MSAAGKVAIRDQAHDLIERIAEIEGVCHVVERCLYNEQPNVEIDLVRTAVRGVQRLADLAGEVAMALDERLPAGAGGEV